MGEIGDVVGFEVANGGAEVYYESAGSEDAAAFQILTAASVGDVLVPSLAPEGKTFQFRVTAVDSTSASFEHSFDSVGTYTVSATVNNSIDATGVIANSQVVVEIPINSKYESSASELYQTS